MEVECIYKGHCSDESSPYFKCQHCQNNTGKSRSYFRPNASEPLVVPQYWPVVYPQYPYWPTSPVWTWGNT